MTGVPKSIEAIATTPVEPGKVYLHSASSQPFCSMNKMMIKLYILLVTACLIAGCATHTGLQSQVETLRYGSFEESRQAGKVILADSRVSYGVSLQDIITVLGQPDFQTEDTGSICYRTGGGPLWLTFENNLLIKKAIVSPPRWHGTQNELAGLWEKKRKTNTWCQW